MKKSVIAIINLLLVFAFAACESGNTESVYSSPESSESSSAIEQSTVSESPTSESQNEAPEGKILIVYYSATGNTKEVSEYISSATGGDLFELIPVEPYSGSDLNWMDENSRVTKEYNNSETRNVALEASTLDNWDEYDTVFIGYPIWWGIAAWPVNGFIEANDFTGKTVIPFCTSASSGFGESGKLLQEMSGTGNWLEGKRFSSGASEIEVGEWIEALGIL
ncbi:MAG: flavodoxin [Oscillospiraceae bacterium]